MWTGGEGGGTLHNFNISTNNINNRFLTTIFNKYITNENNPCETFGTHKYMIRFELKFILITITFRLHLCTLLGFTFYCKNTFSSTACLSFNYGDNCSSTCSCVQANSDSCNKVDGTCTCKPGYKGTNCDSGKYIINCTHGGLHIRFPQCWYWPCTMYSNRFENWVV